MKSAQACDDDQGVPVRRKWVFVALALAWAALAQTRVPVVWEPPPWNFPQDTKASVHRSLLTSMQIGTFRIDLEKTTIDSVRRRLGGEIGRKGDAGDAMEWLCFYGHGAMGHWVLWLESGEIDGGTVGSFQWQRLSGTRNFDRGCRSLNDTSIVLPLSLKLGEPEATVRKFLGKPSLMEGQRMIYLHEHQGLVHGIPYDFSNIVLIGTVNGRVAHIAVSKTSSS